MQQSVTAAPFFVEVNNLSKKHGLAGQCLHGIRSSYPAAVT
jgi:hypothetical protein